jgi:hypothetical protein
MSSTIDITLDGKFNNFSKGMGFKNSLNYAQFGRIERNGGIEEIAIYPGGSHYQKGYHIFWENCSNKYFYSYDEIENPIIHLDVIDDSKPIVFSYYYGYGEELIGKIELDPLHNNGLTISGTKVDHDFANNPHLIFDNLNNINDVIHINPVSIF